MNARDALFLILGLAAAPGLAAAACPGVGVITRIDGRPENVAILRGGAPVARPRVLEVLCQGDTVKVANGTVVTLSLDGRPPVKVQGTMVYSVGARAGGPSIASNAYVNVSNHLMPDMKRQPWDVRLRGPGRELSFAAPGMAAGGQNLTAGPPPRDLLVRLDGGVGSYKVALVDPAGRVVGQGAGASSDIYLRGVALAPGRYLIRATDSSGGQVEAAIVVTTAAPPTPEGYAGLTDAEVRAAAQAADLAREHGETWAFEAEQILAAAPAQGLDRESVYELIESYGAP
jgi:hypothetical protein